MRERGSKRERKSMRERERARERARGKKREGEGERERENGCKGENYEKRMSLVAEVKDNAGVVGRETEGRGRGERK